MAQQLKEETKDAIRQKILDCASEILSEEGSRALSMRKLSQKVGASTIVLYTYFENKQDIFNQLFLEGFDRFRRALEATPKNPDALEYLCDLGRSYHQYALDNPTYYQIMFGQDLPDFTPPESSRMEARKSLKVLIAGVQVCIDQKLITSTNSEEVAQLLWSSLHGVTSLELVGYFPSSLDGTNRLELALETLKQGLRANQPI